MNRLNKRQLKKRDKLRFAALVAEHNPGLLSRNETKKTAQEWFDDGRPFFTELFQHIGVSPEFPPTKV